MVLVPGGGFSWKVFDEFMSRHESDFRIYAVTLSGMGGTPAPPMPPPGTSYMEQTWLKGGSQALLALIRAEKLERPILVGSHLDGSQVVLKTIIDHPESVRAAIFLGGSGKWASPRFEGLTPEQLRSSIDGRLAGFFKTVSLETWNKNNFPSWAYSRQPELARELYEQVSQGPLPAFVRYLLEYWSASLALNFDSVQTPTLVCNPAFDDEHKDKSQWLHLYYDESWKKAKSNPSIRTRTIPESQIFVWLDQPEKVDQAIRDFLKTLP